MNTPAHALLNLALLARRPATHSRSAAIVAGALIPDAVIVVFYAWQLLRGSSESEIWSTAYYQPLWQAAIDVFNSIPLIAAAMLLAWHFRRPLLLALAASMLLHALGDLPLHHDDAHRHFFPFADWRFASPVSYWDPAHHGDIASLAEAAAVLGAATYLWIRHAPARAWVVAGLAIYLAGRLYAWLVWA